ncbi:MAG TPA: ATP-binding protein [Candidatus Nitrosotalea sp.]|nr:ATP-binding protein [Candidatus Nitrosotalea sp.]
MRFGVKVRLALLALVVGLMGVLIALMTLSAQRQGEELRARLSKEDLEQLRTADQFRDSLRDLNSTMFRFGVSHDPSDLKEFLEARDRLDRWIDKQKPKFHTEHETNTLNSIDLAYDDYMRVAKELQTRLQSETQQKADIDEFTPLRMESQRLFDLGQELTKAHYESRNLLLAHANLTLARLQTSVLGSLCLLFVFGVALAGVVYRDMIAPLRVKLVESQALMERHEKLASLGMLAAGVAHEIRNPLTAIKAALFIQKKKFQAGTQEHADALFVEQEILRLERIVNDFILFARPSEPKLSTVSADQPLQEVEHFLAPQLQSTNIQILREESPQLHIRVDVAQIKQVLINLVQNAADAVGRNGRITLRARHDRKRLASGETDVVILEVTDTGKGIPPEVEKRLFDPFFTTKDTGTGLGLSIASGIVQKHGGLLQYQTQVNHGTTFGIVLPEVTA